MFKISYNDHGLLKTDILNDVKDVREFLINIVNNPKEEELAYKWCSNASFNDKLIRAVYMIECIPDPNSRNKHNANIKLPSNKEVAQMIKKAKINGVPVNILVYSDETWRVTISMSIYGIIQCWAEYDFKDGSHNATLVTQTLDGRLASDFNLKEKVYNKILALFHEINQVTF